MQERRGSKSVSSRRAEPGLGNSGFLPEAEKRSDRSTGIWGPNPNTTQTTERRLEGTETVFSVPVTTDQIHLLQAPEGKPCIHPISILSLLPRD